MAEDNSWRWDFTKFRAAHFVALVGREMTFVTIQWQVYQLTAGDPIALGFIGAVRGLPLVLLAPTGGVAADVFDRRHLLLGTQAVWLVLSAVLALAWRFDFGSLGLLYAIIAIWGVVTSFDLPARQAIFPNLVPPHLLAAAVSFTILASSIALSIGPAIGGFLLASRGPLSTYVSNTGALVFCLIGIYSLKYRTAPRPRSHASKATALEALQFLRRTPVLFSAMLLDLLCTFFGGCAQLMPIFANDVFGAGKRGLGLLLAAPAMGATTMALVLMVWGTPRAQGPAILIPLFFYGLLMAAFGATTSFPLALVFLALSGVAYTVNQVVKNTLRISLTPNELLGRVAALHVIVQFSGPLLGDMEAGVVARIFATDAPGGGARIAAISGGLLCAACTLAFALAVPRLRHYRAAMPLRAPR